MKEPMYAWHYGTMRQFRQIKASGLLKSRALLLSEELRKRPDWETLRRDRKALEAALPEYMTHEYAFLRHRPVIWFSRNSWWEPQSGISNEVKSGGEWAKDNSKLSMLESYRQGDGLVRLGMLQSKLLGWTAFQIFGGFPLRLFVLTHAVEFFSGVCDSKNVMGYVAASIPLSKIERIEKFDLDSESWVSMG